MHGCIDASSPPNVDPALILVTPVGFMLTGVDISASNLPHLANVIGCT